MSRVEPRAESGMTSLDALERVARELRSHGVYAEVAKDPLGRYDIYIDPSDEDKLDKLCSEKRLSPEAEKLLC